MRRLRVCPWPLTVRLATVRHLMVRLLMVRQSYLADVIGAYHGGGKINSSQV